jgi:hypothetical protein
MRASDLHEGLDVELKSKSYLQLRVKRVLPKTREARLVECYGSAGLTCSNRDDLFKSPWTRTYRAVDLKRKFK